MKKTKGKGWQGGEKGILTHCCQEAAGGACPQNHQRDCMGNSSRPWATRREGEWQVGEASARLIRFDVKVSSGAQDGTREDSDARRRQGPLGGSQGIGPAPEVP